MVNSVDPVTVVIPANVESPVTLRVVNDGVSETRTVAIPFGAESAVTIILFPLKSSWVILPAVPTIEFSSLTLKPFRILLTENSIIISTIFFVC